LSEVLKLKTFSTHSQYFLYLFSSIVLSLLETDVYVILEIFPS
jgi:hypothetical protein